MSRHDRFVAHEFINRYWFLYDEGHLDVLSPYPLRHHAANDRVRTVPSGRLRSRPAATLVTARWEG